MRTTLKVVFLFFARWGSLNVYILATGSALEAYQADIETLDFIAKKENEGQL